VATTIPADVAILTHPDFIDATHSTNWVEERSTRLLLRPRPVPAADVTGEDEAEPRVLRQVTAEVDGRRYARQAVGARRGPAAAGGAARSSSRPASPHGVTGTGSGTVLVPMQGTIVKLLWRWATPSRWAKPSASSRP